MSTFKSIEVLTDNSKTTITFLGKNVDREIFLSESLNYLAKILPKRIKTPLLHIFMEVIKNIYDHGIGKATLTIIDHEDYLEFTFIDLNPIIINFSQVTDPDKWVQKSEENYGFGLELIKGIVEVEENKIDLNIDDTKGGINYSGKIKKPTT